MNTFIGIAKNHENHSLKELMVNSDEAESVYVKYGEKIRSKEYHVSDACRYASYIKMFDNNDFWIKRLSKTIEILNKEFK